VTPILIPSPIIPAARSGAYPFGQSPYPFYNTGINIGGSSTYNSGLPTPGPQYFKSPPHSPSISYNSPLAHEAIEDFFAIPPSAPHDIQPNNFSIFNPADTRPASESALFGGIVIEDSFAVPPSAPHDIQPNNFSIFNPADTRPASDFALFGGTANHTVYSRDWINRFDPRQSERSLSDGRAQCTAPTPSTQTYQINQP
jgi:hypothetical protein